MRHWLAGGASGEATIGSLPHTCWRTRGTCGVQRFDTYKCQHTAKWTLKQYWFCSIDTWLQGVCQSHCGEHDWREAAMCDKVGAHLPGMGVAGCKAQGVGFSTQGLGFQGLGFRVYASSSK